MAAQIASAVWSITQIADYKSQFQNNVDFEALEAFSKDWGTLYIGPNDTFWFDICYVIFGLLIVTSVLLIVNLCMKAVVMKAERDAIGSGKGE